MSKHASSTSHCLSWFSLSDIVGEVITLAHPINVMTPITVSESESGCPFIGIGKCGRCNLQLQRAASCTDISTHRKSEMPGWGGVGGEGIGYQGGQFWIQIWLQILLAKPTPYTFVGWSGVTRRRSPCSETARLANSGGCGMVAQVTTCTI